MTVVGWGTYDAARHPRAGILLAGLRAAGARVVEVNEPDTSSTADRVAQVASKRAALGRVAKMPRVWARLHRRTRALPERDVLLVGYLGHLDVIAARLMFPRARIVLDHLIFAADTASDRQVGGGAMRAALKLLDRWALASADVVVLDTEEHLAMLSPRQAPKGVVVPVGAPGEWFAVGEGRAPAGAHDGPLRVVFYGLYTPLQGAPTIGAAARILADRGAAVSLTMIGSGQDLEATREAAGDADVEWRDWVEPAELPALVASHDVCLGIVGTTDKGARVVPNKVYQGLAAGCAVVTSDTPPQRRMLGDAVAFVPPGDAVALADALEALAADRSRAAALAARGRDFAAATYSPEALGRTLIDRVRALAR
ncbi:glycosyltransferase [Demequina pelophila]|uniref:glycosyltransferase n=1 Tax=Demequina pelophila TaxID=1638984 RepID=UPI0009E34D65|nr:glycosyltransferase [Demequina pelophila]